MALIQEILGFEGGDDTGITQLGGSVTAAAARSGAYGFRTTPTGASQWGCQFGQILTFVSGDKHAGFAQFCYRLTAPPSADNAPLAGYADLFYITVNKDMTGTVHAAGIGTTSIGLPAVDANLWFRVQMRQWTTNALNTQFGTTNKHFKVVIDHIDANGVVDFFAASTILSAGNIGFSTITVLTLGAITSMGANPTDWNVDYDDAMSVGATDVDVDNYPKWAVTNLRDLGRSIFIYDRIFPVLISGQGTHDTFSPAGGYASVNEVPKGSGSITGGAGKWTDYLHQPDPGTNVEAWIVRINANSSPGISIQALTADAVEFPYDFQASGSSNRLSPHACVTYPLTSLGNMLTPAAFNAMLFGVKNIDGGFTITLNNIYLEVLAGEPILAQPDDFATGALTFDAIGGNVDLEDLVFTVTAALRLANQGEEINVPITWRLERFDIGPRNEEKA